MYSPVVPSLPVQRLKGAVIQPTKLLRWIPDSVVSELESLGEIEVDDTASILTFDPNNDRIRPYYQYGSTLFTVPFKQVVYPAIDPDPAGKARDLDVLYY